MTPLPRPNEDSIFVDCAEVIEVPVSDDIPSGFDVCGNIAEVFERYYQEDKQGRIYYYRTRCLDGHILDMRVSREEWMKDRA